MDSEQDVKSFVRSLYEVILRREPDETGFQLYVNSILDGRSAVSVAEDFLSSDEFRNLLGTRLFVPPGHFYSPITNTAEVNRHLLDLEGRPSSMNLPCIHISRSQLRSLWKALLPFMTTTPFEGHGGVSYRYKLDNPTYGWGDGYLLHAIIRHFRPAHVIEIGSGWSSACTLDTIENYLDLPYRFTLIEPNAQFVRGLLGPTGQHVKILEQPVQEVSLDMFRSLKEGDIVFIDSTHVVRTGSDVCFELFEILPILAPGVLVHIHDIFWPFEYPREWAVEENRSWNETYAIRAFLSSNSKWKIIMFSDWMKRFESGLIRDTFPSFLKNPGGALWIQRK